MFFFLTLRAHLSVLTLGSNKTLGQLKPDCYNARAKAVENFVKNRVDTIEKPIFTRDWNGKWQNQ